MATRLATYDGPQRFTPDHNDNRVRGVINYRQYRRVEDDYLHNGAGYQQRHSPTTDRIPRVSGARPPADRHQQQQQHRDPPRDSPRDRSLQGSPASKPRYRARSPHPATYQPNTPSPMAIKRKKKPAPPPPPSPKQRSRRPPGPATAYGEALDIVKMRKKRIAPPPPMQRWSEKSEEYASELDKLLAAHTADFMAPGRNDSDSSIHSVTVEIHSEPESEISPPPPLPVKQNPSKLSHNSLYPQSPAPQYIQVGSANTGTELPVNDKSSNSHVLMRQSLPPPPPPPPPPPLPPSVLQPPTSLSAPSSPPQNSSPPPDRTPEPSVYHAHIPAPPPPPPIQASALSPSSSNVPNPPPPPMETTQPVAGPPAPPPPPPLLSDQIARREPKTKIRSRADEETGEMRKKLTDPPAPPPHPPLPVFVAAAPDTGNPSPHKVEGFRVSYPTATPTIDVNLKAEIIRAAQERAKRSLSISEVLPENKKDFHEKLSQELLGAFQKREARKQCGTLHMRTVNLANNLQGNSKIYKALEQFNRLADEQAIGSTASADSAATQRPSSQLRVDGSSVSNAAGGNDWTPAHDLPANVFDEESSAPRAAITSRGTGYYDIISGGQRRERPRESMYQAATGPSLLPPEPVPVAIREGDTIYRKNGRNSSMGSMGKSLGSRNAAGIISKSLRERDRQRISGHGAFTDSNGWQVYPASRYDTMPRGPITVSRVEMAPAYAYNREKGELCLLPNFDRVIVTADGKRIREAAVTKGTSMPDILHDVDVKSITGSTRSLSDLVTTTMGPLDKTDQQRASTASIEEERKEQQFSEMQFEQVRYLNKKFREEEGAEGGSDADGLQRSNSFSDYGEMNRQNSWQSNIHPVLPVPSTLSTPKSETSRLNGHVPGEKLQDKNQNKADKKKRRSLKSLFFRSSKKKKKNDKPKKHRGILYDATGNPLYDPKGNPLFDSDDDDDEVASQTNDSGNGLDDSGYTSPATPADMPPSLNVFTPPDMAHIRYGYSKHRNGRPRADGKEIMEARNGKHGYVKKLPANGANGHVDGRNSKVSETVPNQTVSQLLAQDSDLVAL